ncbi:hypothetical protein QYF36_021480 [Acer negundo]|nr:hypothetical protein QYF36_021480 [Acer negundo]
MNLIRFGYGLCGGGGGGDGGPTLGLVVVTVMGLMIMFDVEPRTGFEDDDDDVESGVVDEDDDDDAEYDVEKTLFHFL